MMPHHYSFDLDFERITFKFRPFRLVNRKRQCKKESYRIFANAFPIEKKRKISGSQPFVRSADPFSITVRVAACDAAHATVPFYK